MPTTTCAGACTLLFAASMPPMSNSGSRISRRMPRPRRPRRTSWDRSRAASMRRRSRRSRPGSRPVRRRNRPKPAARAHAEDAAAGGPPCGFSYDVPHHVMGAPFHCRHKPLTIPRFPRSEIVARRFHESAFFPQVRQEAPSRLQGRASSRQGFRDLQEQPALQGAPALSCRRVLQKRAAHAALFVCANRSPVTVRSRSRGSLAPVLLKRRSLVRD